MCHTPYTHTSIHTHTYTLKQAGTQHFCTFPRISALIEFVARHSLKCFKLCQVPRIYCSKKHIQKKNKKKSPTFCANLTNKIERGKQTEDLLEHSKLYLVLLIAYSDEPKQKPTHRNTEDEQETATATSTAKATSTRTHIWL